MLEDTALADEVAGILRKVKVLLSKKISRRIETAGNVS